MIKAPQKMRRARDAAPFGEFGPEIGSVNPYAAPRRRAARVVKSGFAAILLLLPASAAAQDGEPRYKVQLGLGPAAPWNMEEPFIDIAKTRGAMWKLQTHGRSTMGGGDAMRQGYIDPDTYLPLKEAKIKLASAGAFLSNADEFPAYYADSYVLDWKGEAHGFMLRWEKRGQSQRDSNSVTYTLGPANATHGSMRFSQIGEGFGDIRLYREKYAERLARGEIWNPEFIEFIKRYDIVRTMNLNVVNNSPVRSFSQIATMDEPWGQGSAFGGPELPYYGIPYEALFELGVVADVELWLNIPPRIGAQLSANDPALRREDKPGKISGEKLIATAAEHAEATLASPEWETFAKELVDRYVASGYPLTRPLYIELGNEIWNYAAPFNKTTNYAVGIARGIDPEWKMRHGYGALSARWMMALEDEFARRSIRPNIIYVIGGHTANPVRTKQAYDGLVDYLKLQGRDPGAFLPKTGLALTTYYGHFKTMSPALVGAGESGPIVEAWERAIGEDREGLKRKLADYLMNSPAHRKATAAWIVARWKEHQKIAESYGSRLIGAYEGGSHLVVPKPLRKSRKFMAWWNEFHWGPEGAAVGREVNQRVAEAFPGIILSNYLSIGRTSPQSPWIDGHYAKRTPIMEMWDEVTSGN